MKRITWVTLVLACLTARMAGAADSVNTAEDVRRQALAAVESNAAEIPRPQLSANTNTGPEVPMAREPSRPAAPSAAPVGTADPPAAQPRNPVWIILAVLGVIAARFVLKRLVSRSRPS